MNWNSVEVRCWDQSHHGICVGLMMPVSVLWRRQLMARGTCCGLLVAGVATRPRGITSNYFFSTNGDLTMKRYEPNRLQHNTNQKCSGFSFGVRSCILNSAPLPPLLSVSCHWLHNAVFMVCLVGRVSEASWFVKHSGNTRRTSNQRLTRFLKVQALRRTRLLVPAVEKDS